MDLHDYVHIGKIGKAQGIKGEVRIIIFAGMPDELTSCPELILKDRQGNCRSLRPKKVRRQGAHLIVAFEDAQTRNDAEALTGLEIWIHQQDIPQRDGSQGYWYEFEGLHVVTDEGAVLGVVESVFATGANDVLVVAGRGKEYLIPVIDDVIVEVSKQAGVIHIRPLPGLLDMNS